MPNEASNLLADNRSNAASDAKTETELIFFRNDLRKKPAKYRSSSQIQLSFRSRFREKPYLSLDS